MRVTPRVNIESLPAPVRWVAKPFQALGSALASDLFIPIIAVGGAAQLAGTMLIGAYAGPMAASVASTGLMLGGFGLMGGAALALETFGRTARKALPAPSRAVLPAPMSAAHKAALARLDEIAKVRSFVMAHVDEAREVMTDIPDAGRRAAMQKLVTARQTGDNDVAALDALQAAVAQA